MGTEEDLVDPIAKSHGPYLDLPERKKRVNIMFIGSSLDHNAFNVACEEAGQTIIHHPSENVDMQRFFGHCHIDNYTVGFFQNWGSSEPPYWRDLYKNGGCIPKQLAANAKGHVMNDAPKEAERMFGTRNPELIVVDSSIWDL